MFIVHPPKRVTCHVSHVTFFLFFLQSGEAYRWRVCYQRGLPRLVSIALSYIRKGKYRPATPTTAAPVSRSGDPPGF